MSALRYYYVSIAFARFDELEVHRLDCFRVPFYDGLYGLASFYDVPGHYPHEPVIIVGIDEYLDIHLVSELCASENKYAFYDDYFRRIDCDGLGLGA